MNQTQTGLQQDEKLPIGREKASEKQPTQSQADRMNRAEKQRDKLSADTAQESNTETSVKDDAEITEEMNEEVTEAVKEAVSEIADKLGVSEEAVLEAMEALGISLMDLTNQGTMAQLVTTLTGLWIRFCAITPRPRAS